MKRLFSTILLLALSIPPPAAWAGSYDAKCRRFEGKFSKCILLIESGRLKTFFKDDEYQSLNVDIQGNQIRSLAAGEVASRRLWESVGGAVVLGPLAFLGLLWKDKATIMAIAYEDRVSPESAASAAPTSGEPIAQKVMAIRVPRERAILVKAELETLSGLKFESEPE